jgi:hypothetical protein
MWQTAVSVERYAEVVWTGVVPKVAVVVLIVYATVAAAEVLILNYYASFLVERLAEMRTKARSAMVTATVLRVSVREPHDSRMSFVRFLAVCSLNVVLQQLVLTHLVLVEEEVQRSIHNSRIEDAMLTWSCQLGIIHMTAQNIRLVNRRQSIVRAVVLLRLWKSSSKVGTDIRPTMTSSRLVSRC